MTTRPMADRSGDDRHVTARRTRFGDLVIGYDERVLEPRPWTLLQSMWAVELERRLPAGPILELCAGAGHIGLAVAQATGRHLVQIDADPIACAYARANADAAGVGDRVHVCCQRLETGARPIARFPLVIADPPYVPRAEVHLHPHDPGAAIDGGDDGLDIVRACIELGDRVLPRGGGLLLQTRGRAQVDALDGLLPARLAVVEVREVDACRAVALLRDVDPATRRTRADREAGHHVPRAG